MGRRRFWAVFMIPMVVWTAGTAAGQEKKVPERSEIEKKYLWATELIYPSEEAWAKDLSAVDQQVEKLAGRRGTMKDGASLLETLKLRDEASMLLEKVYVYASLLGDQDTRQSGPQAMESRARGVAVKYGQATSWLEPELTAISQETLDGWMKATPDLGLYRQYFDNLFRQKKYILSPREEELLAMGGQVAAVPAMTYNLLVNSDIKFPTIKDADGKPVELSDAAFYIFMSSPERRVRKDAYEGIVGTYAGYKNTAASLLNGGVQNHIYNVRARGYQSCLAAALDGGNIPVAVYNNLISTVNESLPLLHRYTTLRKKLLKLDDGVHDYDLYVPLTDAVKLEYSYEDGVKLMLEGLAPLGQEYLDTVRKGVDSRWIDVFTTRGKQSGAYSSGTFLTQPFILLNYFGRYDDVSTLAHEMGHSMHSYLSHHNQPYIYADYDIFCAEVASVTNEMLLQQHILDKVTDPKTKLYLVSSALETFRGTVFRQTMFSEFEGRIHDMAEKDIPLTAEAIGKVYGEIMKKYYGPDYQHDDLVDTYWIRIPHFYRNFYVYKYSTSYCAAANIARRIAKGEPGAVEAYLAFLKSGSSKYPVELLKGAGVDMTTPEPIRDAMKLFEGLLNEADKLASAGKN